MKRCTHDKCRWWGEAKPNGRSCYYGEPQCWLGWIDLLLHVWSLLRDRMKFWRWLFRIRVAQAQCPVCHRVLDYDMLQPHLRKRHPEYVSPYDMERLPVSAYSISIWREND